MVDGLKYIEELEHGHRLRCIHPSSDGWEIAGSDRADLFIRAYGHDMVHRFDDTDKELYKGAHTGIARSHSKSNQM